jgi:hypothetical protein
MRNHHGGLTHQSTRLAPISIINSLVRMHTVC